MPIELVLTALKQALMLRQLTPGLVIHTDRGSQYTSTPVASASKTLGRWLATPGRATPTDNAQAEVGWSTLKIELLPQGGAFASLEEARWEVTYYLDIYFNLDRRHSALGYRSPHQFGADLLKHLP